MNSLSCRAGLCLLIFLLPLAAAVARPRLHLIPRLPKSVILSPQDMSADGRVVVGQAMLAPGDFSQAFRVVRPQRAKIIPMDIPAESSACAVSADGLSVLGFTYNASGLARGYLWNKKTGPLDLANLPDQVVSPYALSGNGRVAVGDFAEIFGDYDYNDFRPFYWTEETGLQPLPITGYTGGTAYGTSRDGGVIVGTVATGDYPAPRLACRWIHHGEPEILVPGLTNSYAMAVTPDGSMILGNTFRPEGYDRSFRWFRYGGVQWISNGPYQGVSLSRLSAAAERAVGSAQVNATTYAPVLWTVEDGLHDLNDLFGSVLPRGARFADVTSISANGRLIAGTIRTARGEFRGFVLDLGNWKPAEPNTTISGSVDRLQL